MQRRMVQRAPTVVARRHQIAVLIATIPDETLRAGSGIDARDEVAHAVAGGVFEYQAHPPGHRLDAGDGDLGVTVSQGLTVFGEVDDGPVGAVGGQLVMRRHVVVRQVTLTA